MSTALLCKTKRHRKRQDFRLSPSLAGQQPPSWKLGFSTEEPTDARDGGGGNAAVTWRCRGRSRRASRRAKGLCVGSRGEKVRGYFLRAYLHACLLRDLVFLFYARDSQAYLLRSVTKCWKQMTNSNHWKQCVCPHKGVQCRARNAPHWSKKKSPFIECRMSVVRSMAQ